MRLKLFNKVSKKPFMELISVRKSIELRLAYKLWGPLPENINCILQVRSYEPINLTDIFSKYKLAFSSKILSCKDHGQAQ